MLLSSAKQIYFACSFLDWILGGLILLLISIRNLKDVCMFSLPICYQTVHALTVETEKYITDTLSSWKQKKIVYRYNSNVNRKQPQNKRFHSTSQSQQALPLMEKSAQTMTFKSQASFSVFLLQIIIKHG